MADQRDNSKQRLSFSDLNLFTDVLEKMIDAQSKSTTDMELIKKAIQDIEENQSKIHAMFSNGFRSEIKEHVTKASIEVKQNQNNIAKEIELIRKNLTSPMFWVKLIGTVLVGFTAITAVAGRIVLALIESSAQ